MKRAQGARRRPSKPAVEANALVVRPEAGRELCRQAILKYVPETAIADYESRLAIKREELRQAIIKRMSSP
jgi:hypothetical protein